jgi:hypothetical protein
MFNPVRVLGEQRNHKVERFDLFPHALNIPLFLTQNLIQVFHGYLPAPRRTLDFVPRKRILQAALNKRLTVSAHC